MSSLQDMRRTAWQTIVEAFGLSSAETEANLIFQPLSYTVLTLPTAATYPRGLIYVSNESGGATLAFSDGVSWRRVQDMAVVS